MSRVAFCTALWIMTFLLVWFTSGFANWREAQFARPCNARLPASCEP